MKRIITLSIAFALILTVLTSCGMVNRITKKGAQAEIEDETEELFELQTEEVAVETEELTLFVLGDYLGNWHPANEAGEVELRILSADSYSVEFSLWVADCGEINNVYAEVSGNTAAFTMSDSSNNISGELIFEESLIKLKLEETKVSYLSVGTVIFDGKHTASYQGKYNAQKETEVPEQEIKPVIEPKVFIRPFAKYVSTPNDILNIRTGPSVDYSVIYELPDLSTVEVYGYSDDNVWAYIYYPEKGIYGWVHDYFLIFSLDERY